MLVRVAYFSCEKQHWFFVHYQVFSFAEAVDSDVSDLVVAADPPVAVLSMQTSKYSS